MEPQPGLAVPNIGHLSSAIPAPVPASPTSSQQCFMVDVALWGRSIFGWPEELRFLLALAIAGQHNIHAQRHTQLFPYAALFHRSGCLGQ